MNENKARKLVYVEKKTEPDTCFGGRCVWYECPECGRRFNWLGRGDRDKYCPRCGNYLSWAKLDYEDHKQSDSSFNKNMSLHDFMKDARYGHTWEMDGYDLADEVYRNIGLNENHEISLNDTIRVISFWGFNEEANRTSKIGFVCYCARERIKKIFESAIVWNNFTLFDEMVKTIQGQAENTAIIADSMSGKDFEQNEE